MLFNDPIGLGATRHTGQVALRFGTAELSFAEVDRTSDMIVSGGYKLPKQIHFIDEIPISAAGKPLRRAVREPFWVDRDRRI